MLLLTCILTLGVAQAPSPPPSVAAEVPEYLAHPNGYKAKPHTPYRSLSIPKAINVQEWQHYAQLLNLSNEQKAVLANVYDQYRRTDWEYRVKNTQALWDRSAELANEGTYVTADLAASRRGLLDDRDKVLPRIAQIEREFFAEVASIVSEPQLSLLEVVRLQRERSAEREFVSTFPGFSFDVDSVLLDMRAADMDLTPKDAAAFEALLQAWRSAAGALYSQHADEYRRSIKEYLAIRAAMTSASEQGDSARAMELWAQYGRSREPMTNLSRRIHDLHREYVGMLADALPVASGQYLVSKFEEQAYRPLCPDPGDLTPVFARANAIGFSDKQREAFIQLVGEWKAVSEPAWDQILKEYLSWHEQVNTNSGYNQEEYPAYAKRMTNSSAARIANSTATVDALLALMTSSQRKEVAKEIKAWRAQVKAFETSQEPAKQRYKAWPGPYD